LASNYYIWVERLLKLSVHFHCTIDNSLYFMLHPAIFFVVRKTIRPTYRLVRPSCKLRNCHIMRSDFLSLSADNQPYSSDEQNKAHGLSLSLPSSVRLRFRPSWDTYWYVELTAFCILLLASRCFLKSLNVNPTFKCI
jgi:hypothetical protein